jgi:acetyltransferase-like isoleucine patch superfamily enzyme
MVARATVRPAHARVTRVDDVVSDVVQRSWGWLARRGAIRHGTRQARRFGAFGDRSALIFPTIALFGQERIEIGEGTIIGPLSSLSAGMPFKDRQTGPPIVTIGDRCSLGKGIGIVGHERIVLEDDIWTGHYVYITDQNHGYEDLEVPIGTQMWRNAPVRVGAGSWLGHGSVVLPGADIGRHVVVAAGAVVGGTIPDNSVVGGVPGRVLRRYEPGQGWVRTERR